MAFRNYILLFALVAGTIAGPINVQDGDLKCATKCEASLSDSAKFQYTPGTTYTYNYVATTETSLKGSSSQRTNLKIEAKADIEVLSKCEFALKLSSVSLEENDRASPSSNEFKQKLELKPLRFAFQDGVIENVCSESGEDERVLNVKRAVLSTFQNSMTQLDKDGLFTETDISGKCPTNYKSKSALFGGAMTITKSKDIIACTDRTGNITSIHSESYNVPSKLQNAPLLKSTHECEQDISSSNILQKTECTEVLMFRPFSKDGNGAVTKATQSLTYSTYKTSTSVSQSAVQRRSSMLFHHVYDQSTDVNAKSEVIALLQEICTEVSDNIKKDTPIRFGDLISKMKRLDSDKMMEVYTAVNGGRVCSSTRGKQFFYDAIPLVSTVASLTLSTKLISEKTVQGAEAEMWLTQLAFIPRPTSEMLQVVKPLLDDPAHHSKALLGITAMVHKYCEEHSDCQSDAAVVSIVNTLNSNIGSDCMSTTKETRERILITLKAIGNAGDAFTSSSVIGRCITNNDVDTETRVAALQAFRRMPCTVSREDAMRMYQNAEFDSELRIHAFLAIMTCPTPSVLTKVRMMLGGEPVNQVGSFVWTYLENLKETASPLKQELSSILDDAKLREDFNLDVRKFSRNLEKSFFSDYLNAGAQLESNLIWSQRSYIPRSAMLNVTVDLFGDSINLVEFGGRVQGLEKIVEKFLGPNGYFSKRNVNELMDNKRQTANHISTFDKSFQTPDDKITTSMYVKLFGNEIGFTELDSDDWADVKNFNVLDFLIKLAEPKKIDITKNVQIMDSSLIVPTCIGFPMNLTVNGTATISVDVDGNVDLRNIAASPRSFDINGHIKPSAAIVVSGMMGVDAIVTKSSMKMVSTMHSNTQLDGKITLQDGEIFNVELNTPQEKVEVFHVQTEFFMNGQEMTMPEPAKVYKKCTPATITKVTGMEMCVDVELPTFHKDGLPLPPFTGPMNAQVFIEKKDTHTAYAFVAKFERDQTEMGGVTYTKRLAHMSLDTPGSTVDRKLLVEAVYDPANMTVSAQLLSPWKKFEWSGSVKNEMEKKEASTKLVIDGVQTYGMDAKMDVEEMSTKTTWSPSLTITIPNKSPMSISGTIETGTGTTMAAIDMSIKNFSPKPISLTSSLNKIKNGASYEFDLNFKSEPFSSVIQSTVALAPGNYNGQATVEYAIIGRPTHRFTLAGKFSDNSIGELMSYSMQAGVIPTEFPDYQFNVDSSVEVTANHIDTKLDVEFNKEKLYLTHKTIKEGTWEALKISSMSSFRYPTKNIDMSTELIHEHNSDLLKTSATCTWAGKTFKSMINLDRTVADRYTGEATLSYPGRDLAMEVSMTKMMDGEHQIMVKTQWANDVNSQISLTSMWKSGVTHEITGDVKVPGHPVTFSLSVKPNAMDFMGQVEITYNLNTYSAKSEYKLEASKITSSGSWNSPNRDYSYDIDMSSSDEKLAATTEMSWAPTKKVSMTAEYNNRDTSSMMSRDSKLTITSPYGVHSFDSEIEMSSTNFARISSELVMNGERSTMSGRYSMGTGEFSLDTPYIRYGEIKSIAVTFNHDDSHADVTVTWAPSKTMTGEVKWSETKYSVDVTMPFAITKAGASVELPTVGSPSGKVYWNNKEASLTASYPDMNKGEFTLTYPGHTVAGSFSGQGSMDMFTGESEISYDDKKLWTRVVFNTNGPLSLTVDVTTPFDVKKISANIKHEGTMASFTSDASVTWDSQRVRVAMEFSGKEAKLSVKTPWRDDMLAQYFFNGDMTSFKTNSLVQWAADQKMTADVSFDMDKDVKGSFTISSPSYETVSGSFEHIGEFNNCDNKMTLTWSPTGTFSATSKFSMVNGLSLEVDVTSPKQASFVVTHTGDASAWSNKVELTINNKSPVSVYSEFSLAEMDAKVGIKGLEFEDVQSAEWSVESTKSTKKIDVKSTMTLNEQNSIEANMMLSNVSGYAMTGSLTTPSANTYSVSMTHKQDSKMLSNTATVQWAPNMEITTELDISIASGLEVKAIIDSPWRQMTYTLNKIGSSDEFHASSIFSWGTGKQMSSSLQFSQIGDMVIEWTLQTPFEHVKDVSAKMTHQGTAITSFHNQLEGSYNGQKAQLATKVDMKETSGDFSILTVNPWKNFDTKVRYSGDMKNFDSSMEFTYAAGKTIQASSKWTMTDKVSAEIKFDAPFKTFDVSCSHEFSLSGELTGMCEVSVDNARLFHSDMKYLNTPSNINLEFSVESPWKSFSGKYSHVGTMQTRCNAEAEFTWESQTVSADWSVSMATGFSTEVTVRSPWRNLYGEIDHVMSTGHFENTVSATYDTGKTVKLVTEFDMTPDILVKSTFTSPFKNANVMYRHSGSWDNFACHFNGAYGDMPVTADLKWNAISGYEASFDLSSPWKNVKASFETTTDLANLSSSAKFEWGSEKMESTLTFNTARGYQGEMNVKTPWRDMSANFNWNRNLLDLDSTASVSWDTGKSISAVISNKSRTGRMELVTPWKTLSTHYTCSGTWENYSAMMDFSWESGKKITLDARADSTSGLDTEWKLTTPWRTMSTAVKYDSEYNTEAMVSWDTGKSVDVDIKNTMHGDLMSSSVKINSPWRAMSGSYSFDGTMTKFDAMTEFSWVAGQSIKVETSWNMETGKSGSATITTPWRTMSTNFNHAGDWMKFNGNHEISWVTGKKITTSVFFNRENGWESRLAVSTPWKDVETNMNFNGKLTAFTSGFDFSWETGKKMSTSSSFSMSPLAASWSCKTPAHEMSAELKHDGNLTDFTNSASFSWEPTKKIEVASTFKMDDDIMGHASVKTPFGYDVALSFEHTPTSGEMSFVNPWNNLEAEYTYSDMYNVEGKFVYGTTSYQYETVTTWNNGLQTLVKCITPQRTYSVELDHQGDFSVFRNTFTANYGNDMYKLITSADVPKLTFSQSLTTPIQGYETQEWTASFTVTDSSVVTRATASQNTNKFEVDFNTQLDKDGNKTVMNTMFKLTTPIVGYESIKFLWNASSNSNMCQSSFSYALNSVDQVTYTQKTNWTSDFMNVSHETTMKVPSVDKLKDCDITFSWDFTQPKKTMNLAMFNDPTLPIDFKAEYENMNVMVEIATPFDAVKMYKTSVTINRDQQPWTVKVESQLNQKTITFNGRLSYTSWKVFDFTSSFTSQIPMFESLTMSVSSTSTQGQWKPHASMQWASDKKVDMGATISLTNPYKATLEFSSPFESWRSMSMDAELDNSLPTKLTASFEFNTNTLSKKLSSQLNFDMDTKSFMFTLNTPWQTVNSFEMSSAMKPRVSAFVKLNGETWFSVSGNAQVESLMIHDMDITITYPFLNKYMRLKINNDLVMSGDDSMHSYMDLEYMRGSEMNFKFDFKNGNSSIFSLSLETPFAMLEKTSYSVQYSGTPQSWTENTVAEFYYGKITTRTTFSMIDGLAYHQTVNGQMKNGVEDFNFQKDLIFTGDTNKFDLQSSMSGSMVPTMKFETSWQYNPITVSLKTTFNKYSIDYTHTGPANDFTCKWTVVAPESSGGWFSSDDTQEWVGTFSFNNADELVISADMTCAHNTQFEFTINANSLKGNLDSSWKFDGEDPWKFSTSYERVADPFRYKGSMVTEGRDHKLSISVDLTENSINFPIVYDDKEYFAIRANNPLNADKEYVPTINMVIDGEKYEFDGLFKNEGEGLVRDFKLHMNGPRGDAPNVFKFQLEFRTQSSQMVPGDMKLYISSTNKDTDREYKMIDMTAEWGNDHALFTFREPQPMRYSIDFSVSTRGQTGTIEANWDTDRMDRNMKMDFSNKFSTSSQQMISEIEVDMVYGGISRGFASVMDWQTGSFEHKLTFDYNGKEMGYDVALSKDADMSVEIITQWRNVKFTWNMEMPSDVVTQATLGIYWDSARDMSKRFLGTSRLERTDVNTYKWTTTMAHPALPTNLVITDNMSYDTSNVVAALNKKISYSTDKTKDIVIDMIMEKSGKWGVELKQDFNKVDFRVGSEFTKAGSSSTVMYKAVDGRMKTFTFSTTYDSSSKKTSMQLVTPLKTIKLETMASSDTYTVSLTVDGKMYTSAFTVQPDNMYMLIKMSGQQTDVELEAKKLPSGYQVQLVKMEGSKTTIEGLASISMNESNTVNGKLYWNPTLVSEIQTKIAALRTALKDTVKTMYTASANELSNKKASMKLGNDFDQIMPHHESELALFKSDIAAAKTTLQQAYSQDVFFMKSIDEATSGCITWLGEMLNEMEEHIMEFYEDAIEPWVQRIRDICEQMYRNCMQRRANIVRMMQEVMDRVAAEWNEQTEEIREDLMVIGQWFQVYLDHVTEFISEHPVVQTLKAVHTTIMDRFTTIVDAIYNQVIVITDPQMYADVVYDVHSYMTNKISSSLLTGISDSMMYKLKYYYDYYQLSDNMKIFLTHAKNVVKEYMNDYLTHYIDNTLDGFKWVTYDLSIGHIEFEFVIPTTLDNINMLAIRSNLIQSMTSVMGHMREHRLNMRDIFDMYKPTSFSQILPPFDAQAIIAGQHIRTFDKRHYDFSSNKCSYLLARDFHDGNFTIYVNYKGDEQSITVHSNGKTVDIEQDNSVKLDGAKVELPYQFFNTTITRMGSKVILSSTLGMKVICENTNGLCTVDMSGHYFAKTGGLLGTYNYEPLDDFMTSANTNTTDVLEFANSWTSGCKGVNTAKSFSHVKDTKEYKACATMFKDASSPMSSCFSMVNPEQAFHKCVNDMGNDVTLTATNGPCKAVVLYKAECEFAGISLEQPAQCVSCQVGGNTIQQGETFQITQPIMAADIVFIVEEKMCNEEIDSKLPTLAKLIESSLSTNSYSDIRFGLVGFGGEHVHSPSHTHTMDSKMLAARSELALGTAALAFSSNGSNKDVFDAIDFATGYPFRAGANKVMIVLPCSDCSESEHSYRSVAEKLAAEDITVHVINEFDYEITLGKNPSTNYLFGIDNGAVYSLRDVTTFRGTTRLYPIVNKPTDSCSSLALQTDGTVFNMNMMTKKTGGVSKNFQTVFATRLARYTTPSSCTSCSCEYNPMFAMSRSVCQKC